MTTKHQCPEFKGKEANLKPMATKRQCPEFSDKEVQAKATQRQCPKFWEREVYAQLRYGLASFITAIKYKVRTRLYL